MADGATRITVTLGEVESDVLVYLVDYPTGSFEETVAAGMIERGVDERDALVGVRRGLLTLRALGLAAEEREDGRGVRWYPTPEGVRLTEKAPSAERNSDVYWDVETGRSFVAVDALRSERFAGMVMGLHLSSREVGMADSYRDAIGCALDRLIERDGREGR